MFHYIFWFALAFPQKHHNARGEYTAPKNNLKKEVCNSVGYIEMTCQLVMELCYEETI